MAKLKDFLNKAVAEEVEVVKEAPAPKVETKKEAPKKEVSWFLKDAK
jgi:hypothetical protein